MEVWLPYGLSEVPVRIPDENLVDILQPRQPETPADVNFDNISTEGLTTAAKSADRICIVAGESRNQAMMSNAIMFLINRLSREGVPLSSLTVLRSLKAGSVTGLPSEVQVVTHSPLTSPAIAIGQSADFAISINSIIATEKTLIVVVGELRLNHVLGFSGLCDAIFPGLAAEKSAQAQLVRNRPMDPHDLIKERLEITSSLPNVYGLGFVLGPGLAPIELVHDTFDQTVSKLGATIHDISTIQASRSADIVVMSTGGMPLDESLVTAVESLPPGLSILKRNGALIVAAECSLGHGGTDFYAWVKEKKEARHLETRLRHHFNFCGWKAAYLLRALNNHRIYLASTIPDHHLEHTFGLKPAKTMNAAVQAAQRALGSDASISVIPNAGLVLPTITQATQEPAKGETGIPER